MNERERALLSLIASSEGMIAFPRAMGKFFDNNNIAIVFNQLLFWYGKMNREFYKTDKELADECNLSLRQLKRIKYSLVDLGYITTSIRKVNGTPTTFYKVNLDKFLDDFTQSEAYKKHIEKEDLKVPNGTMESDKMALSESDKMALSIYTKEYTEDNNTKIKNIETGWYHSSDRRGLSKEEKEVWEYFLKMTNKTNRYTLTRQRKKHLKARLKHLSVEDMKRIIYVIVHDPFMSGKNDAGKVYWDFENMFRSQEKAENWLHRYIMKYGDVDVENLENKTEKYDVKAIEDLFR